MDNRNKKIRLRINHFMQESLNIVTENLLLRFAVVGMLVFSALNTYLLEKALRSSKTIITPPDNSYSYEITGVGANNEYLYKMARYVVFLSGNLTAATARDQFNEILRLIHPAKYNSYQMHFNSLIKEIERYPNISYLVEVNGSNAIYVKGDVLFVDCTKKRLVGNTVTRKERLSFAITFSIDAGKFWIKDIKEVNAVQQQAGDKHDEV